MKKWLPLIAAAIFAAWFLGGMQAPEAQGRIRRGRLRPLARFAGRPHPAAGFGRAQFASEHQRTFHRAALTKAPPLSALEWLLDTMTRPEEADQLKVFRIQHPDLQGLLGTGKNRLGVLFALTN